MISNNNNTSYLQGTFVGEKHVHTHLILKTKARRARSDTHYSDGTLRLAVVRR